MDLRTTYMGLPLKSPLVVSACPLSGEVSNIVRMEEAGAGAVVLFSLFEEQLLGESLRYETAMPADPNPLTEAAEYFPDPEGFHMDAAQYLELIRKAKERVNMPVIASLNAISDTGWIASARQIAQAGADGLELNVYYIPADLRLTGREVEQRYLDIVTSVRRTVNIPVAIKLNPYFSAMGSMAQRLTEAGANGLVLFNRFYQPDFDIHQLELISNLHLSDLNELRLPLLWIAVLYGRLKTSLAACTGVNSAKEVAKYLLAGADVVMTASALYKNGIDYLATMNWELKEWMKEMNFGAIEDFKGRMSQQNIADPTAYERANYIRMLGNG